MGFALTAAVLFVQASAGFVIQSPEYRRAVGENLDDSVKLVGDSSSTSLSGSSYSVSISAITVSSAVPLGASPVIDSSFVAYAFEETSFPQYAGSPGSPNQLSVNLFSSITSRTGTVPNIRVGGTSLDRAVYVASQQAAISFPAGQVGNVPSDVTIGPAYFQSFANFANAQYTLALPLATGNLSNTVEMAVAGYPVIKNQLEFIEIGNEPQAYPGSVRASNYGPIDYINEFIQYSDAVNQAVGLSSTTPIYQAIALGSPSLYETEDRAAVPGIFYPNALFQQGLAKNVNRFGAISMHWYQTRANYNVPPTQQLQQELLNHTLMKTKMTFYKSAIDYFALHYPTLRINMAEAASSLNGATNDYGLETTFGAALWQIDWMLWCMYIGIHRVSWQQISASAFNLWQPATYKGRNPAVLPAYYAMLFAADFIGTSGTTRVMNIDLDSDVYAAYGAYSTSSAWSGVKLARIAVINLQYWTGPPSSSNVRPTQTFHLKVPAGVTQVQVKILNSIYGAIASLGNQITYQGYQWTAANSGIPVFVMDNTYTVQVVNGIAAIVVKSSSAVMVYPQYS